MKGRVMGNKAYLHGGPLDGQQRTAPAGQDGEPMEQAEFEHESGGTPRTAEYRRSHRHDDAGWHYEFIGQPDERA
jgi:hypothetical protein